MRYVVYLLLLLQPLLDTTTSNKIYADKTIEFRIRSQNLHVDAVEKRLAELENELEELHLPNVELELNRLEGRVLQIESERLYIMQLVIIN